MLSKSRLKIILTGAALIVVAFVLFLLNKSEEPEPFIEIEEKPLLEKEIIGKSVEGRDIEVFKIGEGDTNLLFVGGIHGGYEWNSIILAYEMIDYFKSDLEFSKNDSKDDFGLNDSVLPGNISLHIIPNLNPDGVYKALGLEGRFDYDDVLLSAGDGLEIGRDQLSKVDLSDGRFNANNIDLNRNFDCKWQPKSSWRGREVSAGTKAFSEPEAAALRNYVDQITPSAAIFWHSQANTVYASECHNGVLPVTSDIMNVYADAAKYNKVETFDAYEVTGDAEGWLASIGIPAITVELETHETVEFDRNIAGVEALLRYFSK